MARTGVPLSIVCKALDLDPNLVRTWASRGIIHLPRGKPGIEHQLDGNFAMRLAILAAVSKAATSVPLATVWEGSDLLLGLLETRPSDERIFYIYLSGPEREPREEFAFGPADLARHAAEAAGEGWQRFLAVEVGQAAVLKVCRAMLSYVEQRVDA